MQNDKNRFEILSIKYKKRIYPNLSVISPPNFLFQESNHFLVKHAAKHFPSKLTYERTKSSTQRRKTFPAKRAFIHSHWPAAYEDTCSYIKESNPTSVLCARNTSPKAFTWKNICWAIQVTLSIQSRVTLVKFLPLLQESSRTCVTFVKSLFQQRLASKNILQRTRKMTRSNQTMTGKSYIWQFCTMTARITLTCKGFYCRQTSKSYLKISLWKHSSLRNLFK